MSDIHEEAKSAMSATVAILGADQVQDGGGETPCTAPFGSLPADLRAVKACLAKEFLSLAEALQTVAARARKISEACHQATSLAAEGESGQAMSTLKQILGDAERVRTMADTSRERLHQILGCLTQTRTPLSRLAKLRSLLQAVGTLSRIEESRLRDTTVDVSTLATDIERLGQEIERHVTAIGDQANALTEVIASSVLRLDRGEEREKQEAEALMGRTREAFDPLHARAEAFQAAAQSIDERYAGMRRAIEKIVMSLQSEDIARQRLDHVEEAVLRAATPVAETENEMAGAGILCLQRSQLFATRQLLASSIQSIRENLQSLRPRAAELRHETADLAGQTERDRASFATAIAHGLGDLSAVFTQYSTSAHTLIATVEDLLPAIANMTRGANELEDIEASIRLIALNAAIKTAHLGTQGAAMSVLATELQSITKQSEHYTHLVLDNLQAMDQAVTAISNHGIFSVSSLLTSSNDEDMNKEAGRLAEAVTRSSQEMSVKLTALHDLTEALDDELRIGCEHAEAADNITKALDEVLQKLDSNLDRLGYKPSADVDTKGEEQAENLAAMYSMQSERAVHEQFFGNDSNEPGTRSEQGHEGAVGTVLEDGIELF